jgi:hypothetical protein
VLPDEIKLFRSEVAQRIVTIEPELIRAIVDPFALDFEESAAPLDMAAHSDLVPGASTADMLVESVERVGVEVAGLVAGPVASLAWQDAVTIIQFGEEAADALPVRGELPIDSFQKSAFLQELLGRHREVIERRRKNGRLPCGC